MRLVEVNTVYSAMFEEIKKRKEDLKRLKDKIISLDDDINNINLRYIDSLFMPDRKQLIIELERKKRLRNILVKEAYKLMGREDYYDFRQRGHLELVGETVNLDRKDIIIDGSEDTLTRVKECFDNPFFSETPCIIRTTNDKSGVFLGRDSVSINSYGNGIYTKSDDTAYVEAREPRKSFYKLTKDLLSGVVDIDTLPPYLRSVIESHNHNETVIYDEINTKDNNIQDYYANLDGKKLILVPVKRR